MTEKVINLGLAPAMIKRIDHARKKSRFVTRMEFLRYLLDLALNEWERIALENDANE